MKETWKDAAGLGAFYQVSTLGDVKSARSGRLLKPEAIKGYLRVRPTINGVVYRRLIHRLVLETFVGPPPQDSMECNHKDLRKTNNALSNLEWMTKSENIQHARSVLPNWTHKTEFKPGDPRIIRGSAHYKATFTEDDIRAIRAAKGTHRTLAVLFNTTRENITSIKNRRSWKHVL